MLLLLLASPIAPRHLPIEHPDPGRRLGPATRAGDSGRLPARHYPPTDSTRAGRSIFFFTSNFHSGIWPSLSARFPCSPEIYPSTTPTRAGDSGRLPARHYPPTDSARAGRSIFFFTSNFHSGIWPSLSARFPCSPEIYPSTTPTRAGDSGRRLGSATRAGSPRVTTHRPTRPGPAGQFSSSLQTFIPASGHRYPLAFPAPRKFTHRPPRPGPATRAGDSGRRLGPAPRPSLPTDRLDPGRPVNFLLHFKLSFRHLAIAIRSLSLLPGNLPINHPDPGRRLAPAPRPSLPTDRLDPGRPVNFLLHFKFSFQITHAVIPMVLYLCCCTYAVRYLPLLQYLCCNIYSQCCDANAVIALIAVIPVPRRCQLRCEDVV